MVKKTRWLAWLLATILLLLPVSSVFADTSNPNTGLNIWPAKTTTEVNKVWTISFNAPLLSTSVDSDTIYVTNSKQTKVATTINLSLDGLSVTVTPSKAYVGGDYNLFITTGLASMDGVPLSEMIIVPFTVVVPSKVTVPPTVTVPFTYKSNVNLVVTVTDDFNKAYTSDLSGALSLEGTSGNRLGPVSSDVANGKYTFNINVDDVYSLDLFTLSNVVSNVVNNGISNSVSNVVFNTRSIKLPAIKLPLITIPISGSTTGITKIPVKTANLVIPTKAGVDSRKSGAIGGSIIPVKLGVPVTISNTTTTWTTSTDLSGNFVVYLPTGSYQLDVDSDDNALYKKHSYKMTVAAGQMATPAGPINVEEPINKLGLTLDSPVVDGGSGIISGIDASLRTISGIVNSDATVAIYDTVPETPILVTTAKPDKTTGKFTANLPSVLSGKKLQIKVTDSAENTYILDMPVALP